MLLFIAVIIINIITDLLLSGITSGQTNVSVYTEAGLIAPTTTLAGMHIYAIQFQIHECWGEIYTDYYYFILKCFRNNNKPCYFKTSKDGEGKDQLKTQVGILFCNIVLFSHKIMLYNNITHLTYK